MLLMIGVKEVTTVACGIAASMALRISFLLWTKLETS